MSSIFRLTLKRRGRAERLLIYPFCLDCFNKVSDETLEK